MPGASSRVRVAYFVPPSVHFAGIERVVHEIATGLVETGGDEIDVHVVYASAYAENLLADTAYTKHVLGVARLRQLARALRSCVAAHRFDVLVVPQVEASVVAWMATRGLHLPVFVPHLHGNPRVEQSEGTRRTRIAFALFRHIVARRVAGVLTVSPSLARYAAASVARHAPVHFVPNPMRSLTAATPKASSPGPFTFLNVGRLSRQKGQDNLLRALARARPKLPLVALTLVGTGSEESRLRSLSSELGLDDIVTFAGYASDPAEHFRNADCFVLSSRWEGFGMVLLEALHFGLPLLATDCEFGPSDVITSQAIGHLVATENVEELAAGLCAAVRRRSDACDEAARRALATSYTRSAVVHQHVAVLRRLAGRSGARRLAAFASA